MTLWEVAVLAVVQGVSEFLPVSSSGHLVLARMVLGIEDGGSGTAFDAFLHMGTLLAVLWYYRQTWGQMARVAVWPRRASVEQRQLLGLLAVGTVPAAVVGWGWQGWVDGWRSAEVVGVRLLVTAGLLAMSELGKRSVARQERVGWRAAIGVGVGQVLALVPGVSRSGSTIAVGQLLGLSRAAAVRFSFLLSAPIIAGAGLATADTVVSGSWSWGQLLVALLVAFGSGLAAITGLTKWVERVSWWPFVGYLVMVGVVILVG